MVASKKAKHFRYRFKTKADPGKRGEAHLGGVRQREVQSMLSFRRLVEKRMKNFAHPMKRREIGQS